jgi:hypothetical protein
LVACTKRRRGETERGEKPTKVNNGIPFNSLLAPLYLLYSNRKCPLISALPYSQRSSEEVKARKGLVAPGSLRLRQRRERRVVFWPEREWLCLVKEGPGGRGSMARRPPPPETTARKSHILASPPPSMLASAR